MIQKPIKVVHYKSRFPTITENWIYNQFTGLDKILTRFYTISLNQDTGLGKVLTKFMHRGNKDRIPLNNLRCLREDLNAFSLFFNETWNKFFHWYPQFLLWLRKDKPHLMHAHYGLCGYEALPYIRWLNIPLITSFYGADAYLFPQKEPCWRDRYRKFLFKEGRLFLVEGPAMRKKLIELGCPEEKVIIHRIGIKLDDYEFRARRPDNEIRLMMCGRLMEKKGIPYAIEALKRLKSKAGAGIYLTIVGDSDNKGTLTDEKRKILNSIKKHNAAGAVTITGFVSHNELLKMVYDHHIFLSPSIHASSGDAEGGFPVVLTEVLATGMPVVAFNHCDIPNIVQNGKSGFLVPEKDVDGLVGEVNYLIENPQIWAEMGRAGRRFVEENHDIKKLNAKLVKIYKGILNDRNQKTSNC